MSGKRKPPESFVYDVEEEEQIPVSKSEQAVKADPIEAWDYGYDSVNSPSGSSTASGPTYVRPPGFEHHGQEIVIPASPLQSSANSVPSTSRNTPTCDSGIVSPVSGNRKCNGSKKKKGLLSVEFKETNKKLDVAHATSKQKAKKEPLPMKLRALPQSFWQQPNNTNSLSPGTVYPVLPPLSHSQDDVTEVRPITPPEERERQREERRVVSVANTDLLFSLFKGVEEDQQGASKVTVVRRGRPKKPPSTFLTRVLKDDDPCMISTVTESILPLIPDRMGSGSLGGQAARSNQGQQVLAMVSLRDGDKSVSLPSLNVEHNYSQILSELVMKL